MSDPAPIDLANARRDGRGVSLADVHEAAVIDVGSNSVRLVVYRLDGRAITPLLNEKVMAGLGRDQARTGKLSADGMRDSLAALKRFKMLLAARNIEEVDAVATAAVRDASDGPDFVRRVEREAGLRLRMIPGAEEARLSALGVLAGEPEARGMVGDLGGSSLELIPVSPEGPGRGATFALGPLALMEEKFDAERIADITDAALDQSNVLAGRSGGTFYAVGGAWRALGRIDIVLRHHPVQVLHHHEMSRADALKVSDFVRKQSRKSLERLESSAAKRADVLPYAAVILERVIKRGGFARVILSAYGLREGLLYEHLNARSRAEHPLVAAAAAFGASHPSARAFGAALDKWMAPTFEALSPAFERGRDRVLRAAAARLAEIGVTYHPDQRDDLMFEVVLRAPFAAVSHPERAFLAGAVHHRYTKGAPVHEAFTRLLTEEQRGAAAALGAAMRLGADISGRASALLDDFALTLAGDMLTLSYKAQRAHLVTDQAEKRLEPLAKLLGVRSEIVGGLRR